ncbi:MAG: tetratricopeptide repeat protein [Bacteroidales bacterium]
MNPIRTWLILAFCLTLCKGMAQSSVEPIDLLNQLTVEKDDFAKLDLLIEISEFYRQNDITKSVAHGRMASHLAEKLNDDEAIVKAYLQLGEAYFTHHKLDSVDIVLSRIEPLVGQLNDTLLTANTYVLKGSLAGRRNQFETGIKYLKKGYELQKQIGNIKGVAIAGNKVGLRFAHQSKNDSAMYYYLDAMRYFLQVNDSIGYAMTSANIGLLHFRERNYDKGFNYVLTAINIYESRKYDRYLVTAYNNMGMAYYRKQMYEEAILYYSKSIDLAERINLVSELPSAIDNLGGVYADLQQYDKAYAHFTRALEIHTRIGNLGGVFNSMKNQAVIQERLGNYAKALNIYDSCLTMLKSLNNPDYNVGLYFNIYRTYALDGNFKDAYYYQEKYFAVKDSVYNIEKVSIIADLEQKYEKEKDQSQILTLKNEALFREIALKKRTTERNASIVGALFILLTAFFVFVVLKQKSKRIRLLKEKEIQRLQEEKKVLAARALVEGQEEERKRVAQELHDGIGVLLSSVKLQFTRIEDQQPEHAHLVKQARNMLDKAAGDIRRISHNIMPGNLIRFGLDAAVEDLFESINESGLIKAETEIHQGDTKISENFQIMVYRIIQELANNTLKHADAKNISLVMNYNNRFSLQYADNGKGFNPEGVMDGPTLGIKSISSRVNFMEGEMNIESSPGKGTSVFITIPSIKK